MIRLTVSSNRLLCSPDSAFSIQSASPGRDHTISLGRRIDPTAIARLKAIAPNAESRKLETQAHSAM